MIGLGIGVSRLRRRGGGGAPSYFAMTVDTTKSGGSNNDQFQFTGAAGEYDVDAVQNDVVVQSYTGLVDEQTITLPSAGIYQVRVKPVGTNPFNRIKFRNSGDKDKVLSIDSFGTDVVWSDFSESFRRCENLTEIKGIIYNGQNITTFFVCFGNTSLTALPKGLFDNCPNVTDFQNCFLNSSLTSIPKGLFNNCPNVTTFRNCFRFTSLTALPKGLFNNCPNVTDFGFCFQGSTLTVESLSRLYIELSLTNVENNVPFHGGSGKYNPAFAEQSTTTVVERQNLLNRGFTITDGGTI